MASPVLSGEAVGATLGVAGARLGVAAAAAVLGVGADATGAVLGVAAAATEALLGVTGVTRDMVGVTGARVTAALGAAVGKAHSVEGGAGTWPADVKELPGSGSVSAVNRLQALPGAGPANSSCMTASSVCSSHASLNSMVTWR